MKFMSWEKDGGDESTVSGLYIVEIKSLFSIVLLRFSHGSRDAFHSHAFNCWSVQFTGYLYERFVNGTSRIIPKWWLFPTYRTTFHKVASTGTSWVLSFRGPWRDRWEEYLPRTGKFRTLTHGRVEVD